MSLKYKIIILSSGTGSGVNAIRALKLAGASSFEILAADADPSAPGLFLADRHYILPKCGSPQFFEALCRIAEKEGSELFCLPTFSGEIEWFSTHAEVLSERGIRTLLAGPQTIRTCNDKWLFSRFIEGMEIAAPRTLYCSGRMESFLGDLVFPVFIKQITGSGSRFATMARSLEELEFHLRSRKELIVQDYIAGEEVTVDVFCNKRSALSAVSARKRISVKAGQSVKGLTVEAGPFLPVIERVCGKLQLRGVSNFQFILSQRGPVLLEVNPRLAAGGLMLSVHAGVNIPLLWAQEMLGGGGQGPALVKGREGLCMSKFWNEIVYGL